MYQLISQVRTYPYTAVLRLNKGEKMDNTSLRKSRVLKKLRNDETAISFKANLSDPRAVEIAAMNGFDCIWTCMEHVPNSIEQIERQIMVCKAYDTDIVLRVRRGSYSDYVVPLEMDATGIMVPHIMSAADARKVAKTTRFHPIGLRPLDGGNADGKFCNVSLQDYMVQANQERFVIVQIEDPEPMEELDEICQIEGIDMIFFGPADYSQSIGIPGKFDDPRIMDARIKVVDTARKYGKFAGTVGSLQNFKELIGMGYRFINLAADVVGLQNYCKDIYSKANGIRTESVEQYK